MLSFIKRVTSAVVAGAIVLGSIALYPDAKKNVVNAAETKYDSASLVNYATIMGRAVDYGIVSQSITQSMHMETTFATFSYSRTKDTTTDVDLTNAKTAQFIIGEITSTGDYGTLKFGKVKTSDEQVYVKNMRITMSDTMNPADSFKLQDDVATTTQFNYSFLSRHEIQESIDTVIDHARDESGEMVTRTGDSDYVLDASDDNLVSVNGAVTTININDPKYDNKVVYINLDDSKFASLLDQWSGETSGNPDPNGDHLRINKKPSTVVVFTSQKTTPITLGKVVVKASDSPLYASAPSEDIHDYDYYASVTSHSGNQSTHNEYVDKEIAQKLIWNITGSKDVTICGNAGTFLCLAGDKDNKNVKVTLDGSPCAGWLVVNGNVENNCEYHYIYGGNSEEQQTEGEGQMHFVARKGFTTQYKDKDHISDYVDNSVKFNAGDYQFFWQEYTDDTFTEPVGEKTTVKIKDTSYVDFPTLTFVDDDSSDPHYVTETPKDFYFRITEDPSKTLPGVKNSAGYINIRLRAFVERKGPDRKEIKFRVQSVTMIGKDENSLIQYDKNGKWGAEPEWVDVVNARFDLGAFFNKVKVPGYMTLTKTIKGDVTEEDLAGLTFTVTDGADFTVEYKLGRDFTKNASGVYELTTPLSVPDSETKYTVTETLYSLDGYKLEEVSYTVDGGETQHDNDTAVLDSVSTDSSNPTTVAYTDSYTPLGTLKVHKTAVDNNNKNINYYYEFSVKKGENQYLQADKQSFDSTEYYFTIGTNEEQVFENIPVGLYTITEKTDELFVYGYTFEKEISKISGTADVTKKSTVDFTLENKFTQDLGNLEVTKTAKDNNGNAVEGTFKFTIGTPMRGFLQADGTFGNEKHYFTISTGQTLTFENLPVDNYMITEDTESVSVTDYTFNMDASKYSVLGKVTKNGNTNVKLENDFTQDVGTLSVKKTAQDNHDTNVSGTFEFSVKNSKGQFLQADKTSFDTTEVFFTVEAGSHTDFENLPVGKYTVTEKTSSISVEGYTFTSTGSTTSYEATVNKGETSDAQLVNKFIQYLGTLTVAKVATDNNDKNVNGSFQFSVKNSAGKFLQSDEETFTNTEYFFTVAAGSSKTFTDLPVGEYTIKEKTDGVSVPGYTYLVNDSTTSGTGKVSKETTDDSTVTLKNKFEQDVGNLKVTKTATDDNNENVSGFFKFSVKNSAGLYLQSDKKTFDTEVYFFTVAAGSTAVFNNLPVGVYTVTEDANSVAVTGYTFISSSIPEVEAEVEKNESVTAELVNKYEKDVGNLVVKKIAKDNNDKSVAGSFQFSVKNSTGLYLQADEKSFGDTEIFFTIATSETKTFENLPVGEYTVAENKEAVDIDGYTFLEDDSDTSDTAVIYKDKEAYAGLNNKYTQDVGSLTVKKSAVDNYNNTVAGTFKFSVKNSDGKFLQEDEKSFEDEQYFFEVAAGSSKTFENLPVGVYAVEEDTASVSVTGYTFNEDDSTTNAPATVVKDSNVDAELENKFTLDLGSLKITKALGEGYPEEARTKAYNFIINGPDDYSEMRTVTGADSVTITGLKPGKYTVTEDTNDAKIEGYDLEVTGGGEVTVVGKAEAATTITNTYKLQTGSLKITKTLGDNAPEEAALKTYSFTITGPNNYSKTVSVDGAGYVIVEDLVPGKYTVTENTEGTTIEGYDLEVTGGGEVNVVAKATALTTVTNTYKLQLGSLKITKALGANAPESALTKTYKFMITGPDNYSKTVSVEGAGYVIVSDLVPGSYTVTEVLDGAAIADYDLEVTGGGEVNVVAKDVAGTTITNTYTRQVGSLTITKALGAGAPDAAKEKEYEFTVTGPNNYSKTVELKAGESKTIDGLVPGTYRVKENGEGAIIRGYDVVIRGNGEVKVEANAVAEKTVTNTYVEQKGSLIITKALGEGAPDAAYDIEYEFTVTGPNNYSEGFKLNAGDSKILQNLVPGTYTVTENKTDAAINGYDLEVTGDGEVKVVGNSIAEITVTNTYKLQLGSLKVTKALGANAPDDATSKTYTFAITGPGNYNNTVELKAGESKTIDGLVPGEYKVTEDEEGAEIEHYDLEVTGGGEVSVVAKDVAETTVTNTYTKQTGSLTVTKTATDNNDEAVNDTFYFSVKNSEGKYLQSDEKSFGTTEVFFSVISGSSKTFSDLPVGDYTVTEDKTRVDVTGYDFLTTSTTEKTANVTKSATPATAALVNNYEKHLGTLTVQKTAKDNYNDDVTGTFEFSVKNGDNQYLQSDETTFADAEYFFTIEAGSSKTFENLPAGKYDVTEKTTDISVPGYTFVENGSTTFGTGTVSKTSTEHSTVELINKFTKDVGSLKITKTLGANAPQAATAKTYYFKVTGPDNFNQTYPIEGAGSKTVDGLKPGTYTVFEVLDDVAIDGYDIEITGGGEVTVASNKVAETTITNTYTQQKGKLTIAKALGTGAPDAAKEIEYAFTVTGPGNYSEGFKLKAGESKTLEGLVPGTYTVTENKTGAAIDGFDLEVTGDGEVTVAANATAEATVTNTYKQQLGSLKVTKALGAGAPDGASDTEYEFTVTGPNNYSNSFKLKAGEYKIIEDLVPGTYTVTENKTKAAIDGYDLEVSGDGEVTVVAKATALATVTNTYEDNSSSTKGKLKITKALGEGAPNAANDTEYKFTVAGPNNYSTTVKITGAGSETIENLEPGNYTVTENKDGAKIANYDLTVTGDDGKTIEVKAGETAEAKITNTYEDNTSSTKGKLKITKTLGEGAPNAANDTEYKFTVAGPNNYSTTVKITGAGSETIENLEPGNYTVTENKDGAKIANYDLTVTGDDGKTIEVKAGETAEAKITNTYEDNTSSGKGKLVITKTITAGAPEEAEYMAFAFTVTGVGYSETKFITGEGSVEFDNLEPGRYTVTENKNAAKITNYDLEVTGDEGEAVEVVAGKTTIAAITNTYTDNTSSKGSLKITKTLGEGAPDAANNKEYKFTVTGTGYSKTVTVKGSGSVTIVNLEPGKYTVTEDKDGAKITNYDLTVTGDDGNEIEVKAGETANAAITNTYKDNTTPTTGKLKISKTIGTGSPEAANETTYTFTITGPDNYSATRTIKGSGSVEIEGLAPGKYTVTEDKDGAKITNYDLTVTGDDGKEIEVKAGETANAAITNTYKDSTTPDTGKLKITKALGSGAPSAATTKTYKFTVTGPDNYNKSYEVTGAGYTIVEDLKPGSYTVTEDTSSANITNFDLEVTGGGSVTVEAGKTAEITVTNTYKDNSSTVDTGSLTVSKVALDERENPITGSFKFSVKNSEGKYLQQNEKDFDTEIYLFTINAGESKKFTGLPVGTYTVEEDISDISVEGNYVMVVDQSDISVNGNVTKNGDAEAKLINYFVDGGAPTPAPTGAITVTKKVAGNKSVAPSSYSFYIKCGDQYVQDDSTGALGSDKHEFTVDPSSSKGTTITGLTLGKTYVIEEAPVSVPSGYSCAVTYTESNTVVLDKENKAVAVKITNTFIDTSKPDSSLESGLGSLKITKQVTGSTASTGMPVEYRFTVSFLNGDDTLYVQDTAGTIGSEKHEFAVSGDSSVVITGLALDVEYKIEEVKVTGIPADYSCKTSYTDGGTITLDSTSKTGTVVITNNYSYKAPEPEPTTGSLMITKGLNSGAPDAAKSKTYKFKVTGNGETKEVTIKGANSKTIHDLVPGTYTVSEERDGISIPKFSVTVSGEGNVTIAAGETAKIKITNTYEDITGSLTITKALASGAPDAAKDKTFKFTVTGPDGFSDTVEIKGSGSKTLTGLVPGSYKVTENESDAAVDGYNLTVTGQNNTTVTVQTKKNTPVTITNTYVQKMGTLCFTKTFGGDVTESEANGGDLYFIIENTDTSIEAKYLKADGTFTANKDEAHITLADLEKTTATNGKFAFKKNFTVPVGNYKVTEENTNVYFRDSSTPITMASSSVTSSVADVTDGNTTNVELSDVYALNDNLKVTFNKEDEAQHLIAGAELTLTSLDGYDLSNVKVTQGGTEVTVKLSADKSSIAFSTVDTAPSIVSGLKAGNYELKETVTPAKYKTADAIRFTLYPDGYTKRVGDVTVSGSPIVMIDKADPNYHQGGDNPPVPATGEMTSATTMIGATLMILAAACFTCLYLLRRKKRAE
ncbi:hypothetical protein B0O40_1052 [Ruminococcaceae bacterium R-25]|nr:hypothetical protein B0O40_1052 [Ruminococcaceae bacterium R-25]SUQ11665.1 hypothetical protein SAMN06297423_1052 [Oscillospiraceae bacterium]